MKKETQEGKPEIGYEQERVRNGIEMVGMRKQGKKYEEIPFFQV